MFIMAATRTFNAGMYSSIYEPVWFILDLMIDNTEPYRKY